MGHSSSISTDNHGDAGASPPADDRQIFLSPRKSGEMIAGYKAAWLVVPGAKSISISLFSDVRCATIAGNFPPVWSFDEALGRFKKGCRVRVEIQGRHLTRDGESIAKCLTAISGDIDALRAEARAFLRETRDREAFDRDNVGERSEGLG